LQRLLGNMENDGVSGQKRPEATQAPGPGANSAAPRATADAAAKPGFSLK
jgi:pilus assembly protein CpaC